MISISPCQTNMMEFHPMVSELWAITYKMAQSLTTIGHHPEYAIHTKLVVELDLVEAVLRISKQFHHMPERYVSVVLGGTVPRLKVM